MVNFDALAAEIGSGVWGTPANSNGISPYSSYYYKYNFIRHIDSHRKQKKTRMWSIAQSDGRPAEYRWHPLFNVAVSLAPTTRVPCSNGAKTRNPLKLAGVAQTNEPISAASGTKFIIL